MFLLVILRLFLVLKWLLQIIGIIAPIGIFFEPKSKEIVIFISAIFLILPELVMATIIWISKGVTSLYKTEQRSINVSAFDENSISVSLWGYILILTSISLLFGSFLEIPVLVAGITGLLCFAWKDSLKNLVKKYLEINV